MLPEIIVFNKSMLCRLQEYQNLLNDIDTPCSEVNDVWSSIFEEFVVMGPGWQALWMLSDKNCRKYDLLYPTAVIVSVNKCYWQDLTASVTVIAVQEDIFLPSVLHVPVLELHPIKIQDYSEADLKIIADWLDKCRYFFKYLWYPWDAKMDVTMREWCAAHLKNRLQLQYDIRNGAFDNVTTNYFKSLLAESYEIDEVLTHMPSEKVSKEEKLLIVNNYIRRKMVKIELDLFEEPDLRYGMILMKHRERDQLDAPRKGINEESRLVWNGGNFDEFLHYLEIAKSLLEKNITFKVNSSYQEALDRSNQDDVILLCPGDHFMKSLCNIGFGGTVRGLCKLSETKIKADESRIKKAILFECFGSIRLEGISILREEGIAVQVFENTLKISNCRIYSTGCPSAKGIVVMAGCRLEIENSELNGFGTAIVLQKGASAKITDTRIHDCYEGIKIGDETNLIMSCVEITSCSEFGIRLETSRIEISSPLIGDMNILLDNAVPNCVLTCDSVMLSSNKKGDVVIKRIRSGFVIEPSSDVEASNDTVCVTDEDDFEDSVEVVSPPPKTQESKVNTEVSNEMVCEGKTDDEDMFEDVLPTPEISTNGIK